MSAAVAADESRFADLPDDRDLAGKPAAWIRETEDGEEERTAVFVRGTREEPDGSVRMLCQREGEDRLVDTAWERVEVLG